MAKKLTLSFACGDYELTRPLADGTVRADGIDLVLLTHPNSRERHWRMARNREYDLCEFNVCAYYMARDRGAPLSALPVFLHRRFRHGFVFINTGKGISSARDLIGRRVGGTNFQPAGVIWMRGILEEHFGVAHREINWVTERDEDVPFEPPPGLHLTRAVPGRRVDDMLAEGELDALISPAFPRQFLQHDPRVARLFPNYRELERDYYRQTGIFPIMHVTVIREDILEQHPWVAASLMQAFEQAKALAYERVRDPRVVPLAWFSDEWEQQQQLLGPDPWTYGLGAQNRCNLEAALRYTRQQGLVRGSMTLAELFVDPGIDEIVTTNRASY